MKVKTLIELLQKCKPESEVSTYDNFVLVTNPAGYDDDEWIDLTESE